MAEQPDPAMLEAGMKAGALINQAFGTVIAMTSLRTVFEMGLQDVVPLQGSLSADDLAKPSGADRDLVVRILRPLTAMGIFEEVEPAVYRHTPMSLAFRDPRLRGYMQVGWDMWLPVYGSLHSWFKGNGFRLARDPASTPFSAVYGAPLFDYLGENPVQAAVFNGSMEHLAFPVANIFPFASRFDPSPRSTGVERNVLVDVGGGKGQASREILAEYPALEKNIILQDQASVLAELPEDLRNKVESMPYNFFEPQPVKGASFYYMRNILCDWPDNMCVQILKNQASAMTPGSRLLIAARITPDANVDSMTAAMDICMLTYGGAERTAQHFTKLVVDAGLAVAKIWTVESNPWGIIETKLP